MYRQKRYRRRSGVVGLQAVVLASVLGALVLAGVLYGCAQARGTGGDGEAPENPAGVAGEDAVADQETGGAGEEPVAPSDSADGDEAAAAPYDFSQSVPEREAVEDSVSGYLCPTKDADALYEAMRRFVELPQESRAEFGRRGRERMEQRFSKTAVVAETIKHLEI